MSQRPQPDNPATHASTKAPPLSLTELFERCMGNAAIATLVLDKFEKQLTRDVLDIEERLVARDAGQIARTAHALKGSAGAAAATALQSLAATVEGLARQDQLDSIAHELAALRAEVDRCVGYLPTARAALKGGTCGPVAETER